MIKQRRSSGWTNVPLREICDDISYGYTASASKDPVGPKFVRITDIVPELIDWDSVPYCEVDPKKRNKYRLQEGDIVIARTGATTGYAKRINKSIDAVFASYLVRIRIKPEYDNRFVGLVVQSEAYKRFIHTNLGGAAQPQANAQVLTSYPINLPTLATQRKIASILSAYDDLIENNTRRIKILEDMAQMIHREWFVKFRFPGHKKVKMVDSAMGRMPEGWEVKKLGEACSLIKRGISPKYDDKSDKIVINQKCIRDFRLSLKEIRRHNSKVPAEKNVIQGDVLINSTGVGTLGRVAQVLQNIRDCTVDSHVTIVRPNEGLDAIFLGLQLFELQVHFESLGQGATGQTELGREAIANTEFLLAPYSLQHNFSAVVKPLRVLALRLSEKNNILRQTRDLLLPRLISGEMDVEKITIGEGMTDD